MSAMNYIPEDAPFNAEQKQWLNGLVGKFISDLTSGRGLVGGEKVPVSILVGSQTGNSEGLAKKLAKKMGKMNFEAEVHDLANYDTVKLAGEKNVLVITSTYGDGDPPDNAAEFYEWILGDSVPSLEGVQFSVLALGDTEYPDFCKCGIDIDAALEKHGATRIYDRVDCDVDFDDEFAAWSKGVMEVLGASAVSAAPADDEMGFEDGYTKKNPFPAKILANYNLNAPNAGRETHHIELSLEGSGLEYQVGDALGVMPRNDESMVEEILKNLPFSPDEEVPVAGGKEATLRDALTEYYDIRSLNKKLIQDWQLRSGSPYLRAIIEADEKQHFDNFCWGKDLLDLIAEHPADFADAEEFVGVLKKLQPRLYSISSSPKAHPNEVHLTVGIVRYNSHYRDRGGVCSTYLSDRAEGQNPGVYLHSNSAYRLPQDESAPIIMVGPGTGVAPFRAFLEERGLQEGMGENWLFFGNPHESTDFLYREQLEQMQKEGVLTKLTTAFSRDQAEKIYVQHRMLEEGAEIWKWIDEKGGYFYVCGDASRMAKDVDNALHEIIEKHGSKSADEAKEYVAQLKKQRRYARDVY